MTAVYDVGVDSGLSFGWTVWTTSDPTVGHQPGLTAEVLAVAPVSRTVQAAGLDVDLVEEG